MNARGSSAGVPKTAPLADRTRSGADPLFLFACAMAVVHDDDASAKSVLLDAARSTDVEVRTVALNLLLHFHIEEGGVV